MPNGCGVIRRILSKIYQILLSMGNVLDWSQKARGKDKGLQLSDAQWRKIDWMGYKVSNNVALKEHHYKVQPRRYLTLVRI